MYLTAAGNTEGTPESPILFLFSHTLVMINYADSLKQVTIRLLFILTFEEIRFYFLCAISKKT